MTRAPLSSRLVLALAVVCLFSLSGFSAPIDQNNSGPSTAPQKTANAKKSQATPAARSANHGTSSGSAKAEQGPGTALPAPNPADNLRKYSMVSAGKVGPVGESTETFATCRKCRFASTPSST